MGIASIALLVAALIQAPAKLQIKDVKVGSGRGVVAKDIVTVEYTGKLADGKVFDSSKGKPAFVFFVGAGNVIKGWDDGVLGMKVGGKRRLVIPPNFGYGDKDLGVIPPNSTLTFEVELLNIQRDGDQDKINVKTTKGGKGPQAKEGDEVLVHYRGSYLNGTSFDNSYDRKEPLKVVIGKTRLIPGFTQGVTGMRVGEKRHVFIPAKLAYGAKNRDPIPPNSPLVFDLELVSIKDKAQVDAERAKAAEDLKKEQKLVSIEELTPGTGREANIGDTVEINYNGTFPDGKKFDSSYDRHQTFTFSLGSGQVIKGFDLGVLGMKVGGKRKVTIPPELGYGANGAGGGLIPPNQILIFEIELVSVK